MNFSRIARQAERKLDRIVADASDRAASALAASTAELDRLLGELL